MSERELVDRAERERARNELESSLCVEAGAGTGKTTLLVERYLSIVLSGKARCAEIVAITFTEKAAGEMKYRLRREIASRLEKGEIDAAARARLEAAYRDLERAPISTIHAFAATILREHPIGAGIDPFFEQIDAIGGPIFLDRCWSGFLAGTPPRMEPAIARFLSAGGSLDNLRQMAFARYEHRGDRRVGALFAAGNISTGSSPERPAPTAASFLRELRESVTRLAQLADEFCVDESDYAYAGVMMLRGHLEGAEGLSGGELEEFLLTMPMPRKNAGSRSNWSSADRCDEVKDMLKGIRESYEAFSAASIDRLRDELSGWFEEFALSVEERKKTEGVLDFDDLLIRTRELLDDETMLQALRERYRFILVDEFQDTDPLQAEIVYMLAGDEPGRLFVVGDPKQSIYRFRGADVEIYEEVKERLSAEGAVISISQNFRSVSPLVEWVNGTFSGIIEPPPDGRYQPKYVPIAADRGGAEPAVVDLDLELPDGELNVEDIRRVEAEAVGRFIHHLHGEKRIVRDQTTKEHVPVSYRHIAVVYPGTTGIELYEDVLKRESIPYIIEGGKLYYRRQEVRDIGSALRAVENPYDPVALVAVLRSPLFGFSDEELFLYKESGGSFDYLDPGIPETERFADLFAAFRMLARLHEGRAALGPTAVLRVLLRETGFLQYCLSRPNGDQRAQNVRKILQNARGFEQRNISFRSFTRSLQERESLDTAEAESPLVEEDEDAVRLLTVHKAKGLQFPVVLLANLSLRRVRKGSIVMERRGTIQFKTGNGLFTSRFHDAVESESLREKAEAARLLYVAATRAGDMLVVPRMPDTRRTSKERSYYALLESGLGRDEDRGLVERLSLGRLPPLTGSRRPFRRRPRIGGAVERRRWMEDREKLVRRAARACAIITPSGEVPHDAVAVRRGRGEEGRLFGLAFHHLMERVDLSSESVPAPLVLASASRFGLDEPGDLGELAEGALRSDIIEEARRSGCAHREVPFTLHHGETFIEGRIDLTYKAGGGWRIIDYKTDDVEAGELDARFDAYRGQGMIYALALSRIVREPVETVLFWFVRSGEVRELEVTDELLGRWERELSVRAIG